MELSHGSYLAQELYHLDKFDLIFMLGKICKSTSNTVSHTNTRPFHLHKGMQRKK